MKEVPTPTKILGFVIAIIIIGGIILASCNSETPHEKAMRRTNEMLDSIDSVDHAPNSYLLKN